MKYAVIFLASFSVILTAFGQLVIQKTAPMPNVLNNKDFSQPQQAVIADPWRMINGEMKKVDESWVAISGTVAQVHTKEGFRMNGFIEGQPQTEDFFVVNFPYPVAEGDRLPTSGLVYLVQPDGVYTYSTAVGSTRTIHRYNYGIPYAAPVKSQAQIDAQKNMEAKHRIEGAKNALKFNQEQCARGEAYGELRMAERYRDGDGVETNLLKAKFLFMQAADQGNEMAVKELTALTNSVAPKR
jgi:hypothetical protein